MRFCEARYWMFLFPAHTRAFGKLYYKTESMLNQFTIDQLHVVGIYHFLKAQIFQNFWAMSFKNHWFTSYQNICSNISFPKTVNKTCPCGVTVFTSHHKVITSSSLLQGYYMKVYQGYYVTVRLTNHRPFQNRPTLDAKKGIYAHRRVVRVGYSESARWKLSF